MFFCFFTGDLVFVSCSPGIECIECILTIYCLKVFGNLENVSIHQVSIRLYQGFLDFDMICAFCSELSSFKLQYPEYIVLCDLVRM